MQYILSCYNIDLASSIKTIGNGLINHTYKVITPKKEVYILQKINKSVFKNPLLIEKNIINISTYLNKHYPTYLFPIPFSLPNGNQMVEYNNDYFRVFPFIKSSISLDIATSPKQAFEAALQFGKFTKLLANFNSQKLKITLPNFHNLVLRYNQFKKIISKKNERVLESKNEIDFLLSQNIIVKKFIAIKKNPNFKKRVTHHDTKISNVLFFKNSDTAICVIDLDTIMPGYFISDLGDMFRTYLSPTSEEETDFSKIKIRKSYYNAIVKGYLQNMKSELTNDELNAIHYAGEFMIYMQVLRFLTDYLNGDVYYGAKYEKHNYNRAKNQINLLKAFQKLK